MMMAIVVQIMTKTKTKTKDQRRGGRLHEDKHGNEMRTIDGPLEDKTK